MCCVWAYIVRYQQAYKTKEYNSSPSNRSIVNFVVWFSKKMTLRCIYVMLKLLLYITLTNTGKSLGYEFCYPQRHLFIWGYFVPKKYFCVPKYILSSGPSLCLFLGGLLILISYSYSSTDCNWSRRYKFIFMKEKTIIREILDIVS